ncbi:PGN_0703 family putative restriction endonuclease [Granulicella aggregans]|jgi:hypothetical protein|uniref:PGN_0703 family putative restriction endonuclease n=1 Tax=Granulicella aggregans TaxID=474949 RepID=UPI0021E066BA|nr:hypothetical protein [Granulicella aggregans]
MLCADQTEIVIPAGLSLRSELSLRSLRLAVLSGHLHERTDGQVPSILFGQDEHGRHGNFHPDAYAAILQRADWAKRLEKVHTASKRMKPRSNWQWKELDCSNSSDALLMNIFCHPGTMASRSLRTLLNVEGSDEPEFGFKPRVPLQRAKSDATEVDLSLGDLLIEAKLTESDFQWAAPKLVSRYRDLETVFDVSELPMRDGRHAGYQLIRGTLAAYALGCSFCVLCDARRPDLIETWFKVMRAVIYTELRCRLKLLTWQELAFYLPQDLREFLAAKYGIFPVP